VNHAMKNWGDQSKQINLADEDAINEIKNVKEWYVFFFAKQGERQTSGDYCARQIIIIKIIV
jgi:hypothetical protein